MSRIALTLALAILLAGCSGGPQPASGPGAAGTAHGSSRVWKPGAPDTLGPIVATVGERKITRHEVDSLIATAPSSMRAELRQPERYREAVDRLVTLEVFRRAAIHSNVESDSVFQAHMAATKRDLLMRRYFDIMVNSLPEFPDSTLQRYYDEHAEEFAIHARARVRHIALPSKTKATQVRRALQKGALWDATVAQETTDRATKDSGGLLGWVTKGSEIVPGVGKAPDVVRAVFELPIDRVSQPIRVEKRWHLIKVESREEATKQPFDAVKERIRSKLRIERREAYGKTLTDSLYRYYNATIFDDSIQVAVLPAKTPEDFFQEAQAAATPLQRIELYRALVKRYPKERVSVQARFMIGFTYAEEMGEYELAKKEFEEFLKLYPDAELAGSAKWMLENMEKPAPTLEEDGGQSGAPTPPGTTPPGEGTH